MTHTLLFAETVEPRCFIRVGWYRYSEEDTDESWYCVKLKKNGMQSAFVSYCSLFLYNHVLKWNDWAFQARRFHTHSWFDHLLPMNAATKSAPFECFLFECPDCSPMPWLYVHSCHSGRVIGAVEMRSYLYTTIRLQKPNRCQLAGGRSPESFFLAESFW